MIATINSDVVGVGNGGVALRGVTIMFMTTKTPNPYRSEPGMIWRRRSGMRSTARIKTPAITMLKIKWNNTPSRAVGMPPAKADSPNAPLAIY